MFNIFWILIILVLIFLWFIMAPIFNFIGRKIYKLINNANKALNDEKFNSKKEKDE